MLAREMDLPEPSKKQILTHVLRQPRPVHAWIMARASDYFDRGIEANDCEWRACVDVIAWQRRTNSTLAVEFVAGPPTNQGLGQ
jgi:hypothetical protein